MRNLNFHENVKKKKKKKKIAFYASFFELIRYYYSLKVCLVISYAFIFVFVFVFFTNEKGFLFSEERIYLLLE